MNVTQQQFVKLLSLAIRKEKINITEREELNWEELLDEAEAHKVKRLVYTVIKGTYFEESHKNKFTTLKREIILDSAKQSVLNKQFAQLLKLFNENHLPVILLKGSVLKDLYPYPDVREMCDIDILVHEKDLKSIEDIMFAKGYKKVTDPQEKHDVYYNSDGLVLEVHWKLSQSKFFKGNTDYEKRLWNQTRIVNYLGETALTLGYNDFILHLFVHMASHMAWCGFGVRQLLDVVIMIEREGDKINWDAFYEDLRKCKIERFGMLILAVCQDWFGLKLPQTLEKYSVTNQTLISQMQEEIIKSGVHGKRHSEDLFLRPLDFNTKKTSALYKYMRFLFPRINELGEKYSYAKRYTLLAPIAWIHHLFSGLFHKEYSLNQKIKFFFKGYKIAKKRERLFKWIELD